MFSFYFDSLFTCARCLSYCVEIWHRIWFLFVAFGCQSEQKFRLFRSFRWRTPDRVAGLTLGMHYSILSSLLANWKRVSVLLHGLCSTLSPGRLPAQYSKILSLNGGWRLQLWTQRGVRQKVNGFTFQKTNSLGRGSCNPIIPRPHVLKEKDARKRGKPSFFLLQQTP